MCGGAAVASGAPAILGRSGSVVRGRLAPGAGDLGLILLERVANHSADVAFPGCPVAGLGRAVSGVGLLIETVELVGRGGEVAVVVAVVGRSHRRSVTLGDDRGR